MCLLPTIVYGQIDTSKPPKYPNSRKGGAKAVTRNDHVNYLLELAAFDSYYKSLVSEFSLKWKSCGGDNSGMTSLDIVAANLLATYESYQQVGVQPTSCELCEKKAHRYECLVKDEGLKSLDKFAHGKYSVDYLRDYKGFSRHESKKLIRTFKKIFDGKED